MEAPPIELQTLTGTAIESSWRQAKQYASAAIQSDEMRVGEAEAQTVISSLNVMDSIEKNEGTESRLSKVPQAQMDGLQYVYPGDHFTEDGVANFLSDVRLDTIAALRQNTRSTAFDHYEPNWTEKRDSVALQMTLVPPFAVESEWHVTAIAWSPSGTTIAVAYGRIDTIAWCDSKGYVCVWNIQRSEMDPKNPDTTLESDAFVNALAFHPTQPALLAGGTYTGEIIIWDTQDVGKLPMSSINCSVSPREPIAELQWLQNLREPRESHRYVLCSASQDGKIMFWSPNNSLQDALSGYEVQNKRRNVVGVLSMAFVRAGMGKGPGGKPAVPGVENVMLLGLESGDVFRTKPGISVGDRSGAATTKEGLAVLEVDHFHPHRGPVQSVDCSPFFRNLFLTCSSDGCMCLYSTLERNPLMTLEPSTESKHFVYSAQFSPSRAGVVACGSRSSHLHIYDLARSRTKPAVSVDAGVDGSAVLVVAFNSGSMGTIATGDVKGHVRLWELSSELTIPTDLERNAIRKSESGAREKENKDKDEGEGSSANPVRQLFGFSL